jgi:multimeric flavodoxin WrbA
MKALAINGSPRKGSNTETLLGEVLAPLAAAGWETELIRIGGAKIRGCIACYKCRKNKDKRCAVKNDPLNEILEKMLAADAVVLGSPTYFTDVSAEMKALIDRAGYVAMVNGGLFAGKIGAAVVAVGRGGATHVYDTINHLFLMSGMIVPGSSFWNMGYGGEPGEVARDGVALGNMRHLGAAIAWLGETIKPRLDAYPPLPKAE